ncbi:lactate utilization protein [Desulfovibrio sp. OttesenSCG-928-O18]|nr:lactate utilization protein [Desulfovibrio sp. OttesenSCG-928-O18]
MSAKKKMSAEEQFWTTRLERAAEALKTRNFGASVHATGKDAAEYLVKKMLGKSWKGTVNFGGSASVDQSGVVPLLQKLPGANIIATHGGCARDETFFQLRREHFICDLYLCSSNAVTMAGQLLNVDGLGNRVASILYGPAKVVLFVGRNKLCETLEAAEDRVRNLAAPMNNMRLDAPNPCVKTVRCMDCKSPRRICNYRVLTERSNPAERIHVLLINEDLGF